VHPVVHHDRARGAPASRRNRRPLSLSARLAGDLVNGIDAGRATVGALLVLPVRECAALLEVVRDDDPDDPRLRVVLELVRELVAEGRSPDPVAVLAHAQASGRVRRGELTAVALLLTELVSVDACPLPAAAGWYAAGLVESSVRRRVSEAVVRLGDAADSSPVEGLVEVVHSELVDLVNALERLTAPAVLGGAA